MHLQMVFQTLFIRAQVFLLCNVLDTWHCWQGGGEVHPWILQFAKPCMLSLPLNSSFMGAWMRCNEHSVAVTQPILPLQKFKNALHCNLYFPSLRQPLSLWIINYKFKNWYFCACLWYFNQRQIEFFGRLMSRCTELMSTWIHNFNQDQNLVKQH